MITISDLCLLRKRNLYSEIRFILTVHCVFNIIFHFSVFFMTLISFPVFHVFAVCFFPQPITDSFFGKSRLVQLYFLRMVYGGTSHVQALTFMYYKSLVITICFAECQSHNRQQNLIFSV